MNMVLTCAIFAGALSLAGFSHWRAARPPVFGKVRYIDWTLVSILAAALAIYMLVHIVNLLGVTTGNGRSGF